MVSATTTNRATTKQIQRNYKRFLKRIYQKCTTAHWLTNYTKKESIFHDIAYIYHNHPYISSSEYCVTATYVGMVVCEM